MAEDTATEPVSEAGEQKPGEPAARKPLPKEIGGVAGPEPTRYGDWEQKGRCTDF
jgi:hypothetical protein